MNTSNDNISVAYCDAFMALTDAVSEGDTLKIREHAKKTLDCAKVLELPYLEVAVLCMAATGFLIARQLPTVLKLYDEAVKIANEAITNETDRGLYEQLSVQVLLYKGTALLIQKPPQYEAISEVYQVAADKLHQMIAAKGQIEAVDWTSGGILHIYLFDALRILGYCQEQQGRNQAALKHYIKAVNAAEKIAPDIRKTTTLNVVGQALLDLCRKLSMKNEYFTVIDKMNGLLGLGWDKPVPKANRKD